MDLKISSILICFGNVELTYWVNIASKSGAPAKASRLKIDKKRTLIKMTWHQSGTGGWKNDVAY